MAAIYLGYMDIPGCLVCIGIVSCGGIFDPLRIMVQMYMYIQDLII